MGGRSFPDAVAAVKYLKARLVEQKAQARRQKFDADVQLIRNRRSSIPHHPLLIGNDLKTLFEQLDRYGIWEIILKYFTNPSDVMSAYFACEKFRKFLEETRIMMLLPKEFRVFREKGYLRYRLFKDEKTSAILQLRLVSKAWKDVADEEFLVPPELSNPVRDLMCFDWVSPITCDFDRVDNVHKALEKLQSTDSCASLIRAVTMSDDYCPKHERELLRDKVATFLEVHGKAVWAFKLHHVQEITERESGDNIYETLCDLAEKMPNLKALEVDIYWYGNQANDVISPAAFEALYDRIRISTLERKFPILPALHSVRVLCSPTQHDCLVAEILKRNSNLKAVALCKSDFEKIGIATIPSTIWDALKNLRLEYFEIEHDLPVDRFTQDFLQLQEFDWPLKYLHVNYDYYQRNRDSSISGKFGASNIFNVLNHFNDTLEEFYVSQGLLPRGRSERSGKCNS